MQVQKVTDAAVFSSDLNFGTLLYSEIDGSITVTNMAADGLPAAKDMKTITHDPNKKYVRFYPPDCYVFTSTDPSGLKVWDAAQGDVVYSYKSEYLRDHCYSKHCVLASSDEFNLKFYDLRSRYMINSKTAQCIEKIGWFNEYILYIRDNSLFISDFRNLQHTFLKIENAQDFAACDDRFYYLSKEKPLENTLCSCSFTFDGKVEKIRKSVPYDNIQSILSGRMLAAIVKNGIRIEKFGMLLSVSLGDIQPIALHFSDLKAYVFSSTSLYQFDTCIEGL